MDKEQFDEWAEERVEVQGSLFDKKIIAYTNDIIEQNIDKLMENPILNHPLEDYQNDENENQDEQMTKEAKEAEKQTQNTEALFNPVEDDDNQKWIKRHCKNSKKPLNCPSCFNQVAYDYQMSSKDQNNRSFTCKQVFGIEVKENKIIREPNISETMHWEGAEAPSAEQQLRLREEAFNVKILAECSCGYSMGYYDINKECFVLMNVL